MVHIPRSRCVRVDFEVYPKMYGELEKPKKSDPNASSGKTFDDVLDDFLWRPKMIPQVIARVLHALGYLKQDALFSVIGVIARACAPEAHAGNVWRTSSNTEGLYEF